MLVSNTETILRGKTAVIYGVLQMLAQVRALYMKTISYLLMFNMRDKHPVLNTLKTCYAHWTCDPFMDEITGTDTGIFWKYIVLLLLG